MANVQKSPPTLPNPPLLLLCLPGLSSSFVSEHREHRVPLDSHWKTTFNCCIESHRSSFTRFHLIHTTMLMVWNVWHCSSLVIIAVYIIKYEPFAAFRVVTMHNAYLLSDKNWHWFADVAWFWLDRRSVNYQFLRWQEAAVWSCVRGALLVSGYRHRKYVGREQTPAAPSPHSV